VPSLTAFVERRDEAAKESDKQRVGQLRELGVRRAEFLEQIIHTGPIGCGLQRDTRRLGSVPSWPPGYYENVVKHWPQCPTCSRYIKGMDHHYEEHPDHRRGRRKADPRRINRPRKRR
jgi:hypothetical protein